MPPEPLTKLVHQLLQLQRERVTGVLTVAANGHDTLLYFLGGRVVFASSPAVSQTLGRLLLEHGVLTHQQYTIAIGELRRTVASNNDARLGEVLVGLGFATEEDIQDALVRQVARRISSLLQEDNPTWSWANGEAQVPRYPMRVEPLILDGIRRYWDRARRIQALDAYRGGHLLLRAPTELIARCFSLGPELEAVVGTIDGRESTETWLMRQESEDALALLTALGMAGVLAVARTAPTQASREQEARKNPSLAPPGHTGVFEVPVVRPIAPQVAPAFTAPKKSAPRSHQPLPSLEQLARLEAESACRIGIDLLHAEEYVEAEKQFRIATEAMPQVPEYELYWRWCTAKQDGDLDPKAIGELHRLATTTARRDSLHAFPPYVIAHIALSKGDEATAARFFKVAHHRDPDNKDAGAQARRLTRKTGR